MGAASCRGPTMTPDDPLHTIKISYFDHCASSVMHWFVGILIIPSLFVAQLLLHRLIPPAIWMFSHTFLPPYGLHFTAYLYSPLRLWMLYWQGVIRGVK